MPNSFCFRSIAIFSRTVFGDVLHGKRRPVPTVKPIRHRKSTTPPTSTRRLLTRPIATSRRNFSQHSTSTVVVGPAAPNPPLPRNRPSFAIVEILNRQNLRPLLDPSDTIAFARKGRLSRRQTTIAVGFHVGVECRPFAFFRIQKKYRRLVEQ